MRRQRIEWDGDVPVLVNHVLGGWDRRLVLGPDAVALARATPGRCWVGAQRGRRRIWVMVLVEQAFTTGGTPSAARDPHQVEALAGALSVCSGGPLVAEALRRHVDALRRGTRVENSPQWGLARQR